MPNNKVMSVQQLESLRASLQGVQDDLTRSRLVFDFVANHLLTQRRQCFVNVDDPESMGCAYRGEFGLKCAIGALIDDDHYDTALEGAKVSEAPVIQAIENSLGIKVDQVSTLHRMLRCLQSIHDNTQPSRWEFHLDALHEELESL